MKNDTTDPGRMPVSFGTESSALLRLEEAAEKNMNELSRLQEEVDGEMKIKEELEDLVLTRRNISLGNETDRTT